MSIRRFFAIVVFSAASMTSVASVTQADENNTFQGATISLGWGTAGNHWDLVVPGSTDGGTTSSPEDGSQQTGGWTLAWQDVFFDADPAISGNFAVTNNTAVTQTYTLNISMPTFFPAASTTIYGGAAVSINDAEVPLPNGSALLSTAPGVSIYRAKVDGSVVKTLFDAPYSLASGFPSVTANDGANYAFLPGPAGGVLVDIGIDHTFQLSPGDRATINTNFIILPEPATMSLLVVGSMLVLRRKTR